MADDYGDDGLADLLRLKLFLDRMPHELVKRALVKRWWPCTESLGGDGR